MNVLTMRDTVSSLISPHSSTPALNHFFIDNVVFDAMCEMGMECRPSQLRRTVAIDTVANTASYYFPIDLMVPLSVSTLYQAKLYRVQKVTKEKALEITAATNSNQSPVWIYYEDGMGDANPNTLSNSGLSPTSGNWGKRIVTFWPTPTTATTGGISIDYLRYPSNMSSLGDTTEIIDIPSAFHYGIACRAAWLFLTRQGSKAIKDISSFAQIWQEAKQRCIQFNAEDYLQDYTPQAYPMWFHPGLDDPKTRSSTIGNYY